MTQDRNRKRKIRERMALTGENYTTAMRALAKQEETRKPEGNDSGSEAA